MHKIILGFAGRQVKFRNFISYSLTELQYWSIKVYMSRMFTDIIIILSAIIIGLPPRGEYA